MFWLRNLIWIEEEKEAYTYSVYMEWIHNIYYLKLLFYVDLDVEVEVEDMDEDGG